MSRVTLQEEENKEDERERMSDSAFDWDPFASKEESEHKESEEQSSQSESMSQSASMSMLFSNDSHQEFSVFNSEEYFNVLIQMELCDQLTLQHWLAER